MKQSVTSHYHPQRLCFLYAGQNFLINIPTTKSTRAAMFHQTQKIEANDLASCSDNVKRPYRGGRAKFTLTCIPSKLICINSNSMRQKNKTIKRHRTIPKTRWSWQLITYLAGTTATSGTTDITRTVSRNNNSVHKCATLFHH